MDAMIRPEILFSAVTSLNMNNNRLVKVLFVKVYRPKWTTLRSRRGHDLSSHFADMNYKDLYQKSFRWTK